MRPRTFPPRLEPLDARVLPSFGPAVDYPVGAYPQSVTSGDFDADGRPDLAVATGDTVSVLLGNGDGSFRPAGDAPAGSWAALAAADFNNDGRLDLATASAVLLGNGDGTFAAALLHGRGWTSVAAGDLDEDGRTDLVGTTPGSGGCDDYTCSFYPGAVEVLLGNGDGTFRDGPVATAGVDPRTVVLADANADGHLDVATDDWFGGYGYDPINVGVYPGDGEGGFGPPSWYATLARAAGIAAADFDGDGTLDLAAGNGILAGNGDGTFRAARPVRLSYGGGLVAADLNADGRPDLAGAGTDSSVQVALGNGDGTFGRPFTDPVGLRPLAVTAADFNADGFPDLATANSSGTVSALVNDTDWSQADPPWVTIGFDTIAEGNTGTRTMTFPVTLSAAYDRPVTVTYETAGAPSPYVSATAGVDYQATAGTLTFAPGETAKSVVVLAYGDRLGEPDELFVVRLTGAVNAAISGGLATGAIFDDEPRIRIRDATRAEGNSGTRAAGFLVTLSTASDGPVTVAYATADGTAAAGADYRAASGTLTIPAGRTTGTIPVLVYGDRLPEPDETFAVNLGGATNALVLDGRAAGTILDDEPRIRISDVTKAEGRTGRTTRFTFTVTLSVAYDRPVRVLFHTANGTATAGEDFGVRLGTRTFAPGQTRKTITVVVRGDARREADETFFVDLTGITDNLWVARSRGVGTILDDD